MIIDHHYVIWRYNILDPIFLLLNSIVLSKTLSWTLRWYSAVLVVFNEFRHVFSEWRIGLVLLAINFILIFLWTILTQRIGLRIFDIVCFEILIWILMLQPIDWVRASTLEWHALSLGLINGLLPTISSLVIGFKKLRAGRLRRQIRQTFSIVVIGYQHCLIVCIDILWSYLVWWFRHSIPFIWWFKLISWCLISLWLHVSLVLLRIFYKSPIFTASIIILIGHPLFLLILIWHVLL